MISQSIVDKVDMSQFYGKQQGSLGFNCILQFQESEIEITTKILAFKRSKKEIEVTVLCEQSEMIYFIDTSNYSSMNMLILADDTQVYELTDVHNDEVEVSIKYAQDLNCQVKLTIQN